MNRKNCIDFLKNFNQYKLKIGSLQYYNIFCNCFFEDCVFFYWAKMETKPKSYFGRSRIFGGQAALKKRAGFSLQSVITRFLQLQDFRCIP